MKALSDFPAVKAEANKIVPKEALHCLKLSDLKISLHPLVDGSTRELSTHAHTDLQCFPPDVSKLLANNNMPKNAELSHLSNSSIPWAGPQHRDSKP